MQPYFLPYIGYYQLISAVDTFVVLDDVNYINRGWINRNNILSQGHPRLITIPLNGASQNRKINDIMIIADDSWKRQLARHVESAYRKAPCFEAAFSLFDALLHSGEQYISKLALLSLKTICEYLSIDTIFTDSTAIYDNSHLRSSTRIIDICVRERATTYINVIGGKELYTTDEFRAVNVSLRFLNPTLSPYRQFHNDFVRGLSILDVLMFNPPDEARALLLNYTLIA